MNNKQLVYLAIILGKFMENTQQREISTLRLFFNNALSMAKKTHYNLIFGLFICGVNSIYAEAYRIQLAKIQPHIDKVTIEYYESNDSSIKVTYNSTDTQSVQVEKAHTHKEHMHPIQALTLGCQELDLAIFHYSLDVIKQNNIQVNTTILINKMMTLKASYEKPCNHVFTGSLTGLCITALLLSNNDLIKFLSGFTMTCCVANSLLTAFIQKKSLRKINEMIETLISYQMQS